ncbi:MAG: cupin domain-containing protein [Leptospirillum sp.]
MAGEFIGILNNDISSFAVVFGGGAQWNSESGADRCLLESRSDGNESFFVRLRRNGSWRFSSSGDLEIFLMSGSVHSGKTLFPEDSYLLIPKRSTPVTFNAVDGEAFLFVKRRYPEGLFSAAGMINTQKADWVPGLVTGLHVKPLFSSGGENTALVRWDPGTVFQPHRHFGGEEVLVLSGVFEDEHGSYPEGTWYRSPHLSRHHPSSASGCTIFVKTGHLVT